MAIIAYPDFDHLDHDLNELSRTMPGLFYVLVSSLAGRLFIVCSVSDSEEFITDIAILYENIMLSDVPIK